MFSFGLNSRKWIKSAQKTEKQTKNYSKVAYDTWTNVINHYDVDIKIFLEEIAEKRAEYENSLVFMEMLAFMKRLANVQNLAVWGFYHSALLELRFLLETTTLAFYLDHQLPNTDTAEKLKLMQKHKGELWGTRLRRRAYMYDKPFGEEVEKVVQAINNSIDEYMVDKTVEMWEESSLPFSENDFNECVFHTKNATALIIRHFTKTLFNFKYNGELIVTYKDETQTETKQLEE